MFSFRTTPLEDQLDRSLQEGKVGCFCTQNCWWPDSGRYMYELFKERGNLAALFTPRETELTSQTNHIEFAPVDIEGLSAIVIEIQDVGVRYFNYTRDVFRLMAVMKDMPDPPSLYIVDHLNPSGRIVEGCMPASASPDGKSTQVTFPASPDGKPTLAGPLPKIAHRHGLTLGELANLYHSELGAKYPLHVISAVATDSGRQIWAIPPASDIPGLLTFDLYSGGGLWNNTNVTPGIGTTRPYEYIGAPFVKNLPGEPIPQANGASIRPVSFTPAFGPYEGKKCFGYQIMLEPGTEYHSLMHTLQLIHYFNDRYPSEFRMDEGFRDKLGDDRLYDYIVNRAGWEETREHIKVEEQKWIRKAKKYLLYEDVPYRIK